MASRQRYARVAAADDNDTATMTAPSSHTTTDIPTSPPPSFRSRTSSRRPSRDDQRETAAERNLHDAFDAPSDDESDEDDDHNTSAQRQLIQPSASHSSATLLSSPDSSARPAVLRTVTEIPAFTPSSTAPASSIIRPAGANAPTNDGVWANLNAKPRPGEDLEEKPPTYEQAAADATPPYWETTVLSPYASTGNPNDVFVDGLLVGSLFSFVWNALISMSFQLIGFLLTYLLHTTHAAKHGSRAGLGITLVQYGFQMRYAGAPGSPLDGSGPGGASGPDSIPENPNKHNFDPTNVSSSGGGPDGAVGHGLFGDMTTTDWLSYVLMIVGWFILIRAVSDFMRARRQEALVRSSPDRGLGVAVVAEGEGEGAV